MIISIRGGLRKMALTLKYWMCTKVYGSEVHPTAMISFGAHLDKANPKGVHIGADTYIASGAIIFAHDYARKIHADTHVGERCFIGANAIVMVGVTIGDECIIGAGAVVTKDVPSNSIVAGNPARILKTGIHTGKLGYLLKD